MSYGYTSSSDYTANTLSFNNRSPLGDKWTLSTGLLYSVQNTVSETTTTTLRPSLRVAYRWKEKITLEMDANFDFTTIDSAMTQTKRNDPFYSLGYRWDF